MKLATELQRRSTGKTVYILDEPTTGLHFEDVNKLLLVLQGLVDKGNTVIIIEHNLDVVKSCDWIIDLGPEGGDGGGTIVAEGTPEHLVTCERSWTGRFLAPRLERASSDMHPVAYTHLDVYKRQLLDKRGRQEDHRSALRSVGTSGEPG